MKIFQSSIEKDFELFVRLMPSLEPVEFAGLAKILGVDLVKTELVDFDKDEFEKLRESEEMQAKLQASLIPMDEALEKMMDKYLSLTKRRRREINQILKEIKKQKKNEVKRNGTST